MEPATPVDPPPEGAGAGVPEPTVTGAGPDGATGPDPAASDTAPAGGVAATGAPRRFPRLPRPRLPRSRRGLFALLLVLGGLGAVAAFGTISLISWTETADFCGRCHTMAPELQAYHAGPHRDVACAECHVEPGVAGWVKAKFNGTRQLVEVVLGTFPEPIPAPDHANLPSAEDTCAKCHDVSREAQTSLKTSTQFSEDEANTRQFVGLMVRPGGGDPFDVNRGVHWHVLRDVDYWSDDPRATEIDLVEAANGGGTIDTFIAQDKITVAEDPQPDIDAIKASERQTRMGCYDCHNRAGHSIANPRRGVDYEMSTERIDPTLPFVKREAMRILWATYPDDAAADAAADKLADFYRQNYPEVYAAKQPEIRLAIDRIKELYRETATPEMKVSAKTYPDNLGHTDFPGCFRCHDGGHVKVVNGVATKATIPSSCDTCHTFPQIGPAVASLPLGEPPSTHDDRLWVFNHRAVATGLDPGSQSCGECHARDYCVNCHSTGAVTVDHDEMLTNHAKVIRDQGNTACAYCHQPVYCARCHSEPVLPVTTPFLQGSTSPAATGVSWPLAVRGPVPQGVP
jgi:nitrate/TMAO reductase-like tetraheme cytochrome c subunit